MKVNIIYNRVSTQEQNPENQVKDCKALAKKLNLNDYDILQEKKSGYKDVQREVFESIKKQIQKSKIRILIVWDLDRLFRNRKKLIAFFELCNIYNCKIYSFRQDWLESINNIQPPFNEIVHNLMLQVMGWLAEDESKKKSDRVKIAYKNRTQKWGRKPISKKVIKQVLELHKQNKTMREIALEVIYWDKSRNKHNISKSAVHKIIKQSQEDSS